MANLQDMLKCAHVDWKRMGEVCAFRKGDVITKREAQEGDVPVIAGGAKPAYYHNKSNREGGTIVVAASGTAGLVSYWDIPIFVSDAFSVEPNEELNKRYLYHWLLSNQENIYQLNKGGVVPHVYARDLVRLLIPIPPIEVQIEIVRILDAFTELSDMLSTELILRKKQYAYYLEKLLSEEGLKKCAKVLGEDDTLRWVKLGEVCEISSGGDVPKHAFSKQKSNEYSIPVVSNGTGENSLYGYTSTAKITQHAVTVSARETIGYVAYRDYPYYPIVRLLSLIPKLGGKLKTKYLYYCLSNREFLTPTTGIPQLTIPMIKDESILIPPLRVQSYVVGILDKFSALIAETKGALPAEIAMRKKQYEYYRDAFLKFEK